jgi:hypothetical protein
VSPRAGVSRLCTHVREMPVVVAAVLVGAVLLGAAGGVTGLCVGLLAYPPTAWFAVLEVGVPAGVLGSVLGLIVGVVVRWRVGSKSGVSTPVDDDFAGTPPGW